MILFGSNGAQGGAFALESEVGKGSIFTMRLPAEIGGDLEKEP